MTARSFLFSRAAAARFPALFGTLLCALSGCASQPAGCTVTTIGDIPILNRRGIPLVRAEINSHPVLMIVDTGAAMTFIGRSFVEPLGIDPLPSSLHSVGLGGAFVAYGAEIRDFRLGRARSQHQLVLLHHQSFPPLNGVPVAGLLGYNLLGTQDIVVDRPHGLMQLLEVQHCTSPAPLWSGRVHIVPLQAAKPEWGGVSHHTQLTMRLNGAPLTATLDTGAGRTTVSRDAARQAGVTDSMLQADPQSRRIGGDDKSFTVYQHRFDTLQIGSVTFRHTLIDVTQDEAMHENLLGSDMLQDFRMWVKPGDTMYLQHISEMPK